MKKTFVLTVLFILPLVVYMFFASGVTNFGRLPILTESVGDLQAFTETERLEGKITILGFLGSDVASKKGNAFNLNQKIYYHHSRYPGGLKQISAKKLLEKKPEELVRLAVKRMLPKNSLGRRQLKKLKIYVGSEHPHEAQNPQIMEI